MDLSVSESLVNSIQSEIQRATKDLENVDESIRKLTGRDFLDQPRNEKRQRLNSTNQEDNAGRKPSVLSRLGGKVSHFGGRKVQEVTEDNVFELNHNKPSLASSIIPRPQADGKSRTEVVAELNKDKATNARNRRMFGSLLGTLQRFSKDEAKQQFKDDRRAKIIQKVEEKSKAEKEKLWQERRDLLGERKEKQVRIRQLHRKMEEMKQYEAWEAYRRSLGRFIRTKAKPQIFWMPKTSHSRSSQLVSATKEAIEEELQSKRKELNNDLNDLLGKVNLKSKVSNKSDDGSVVVSEAEEDEERGSLDGSQSDFKNGSDILDYEENVLLYEDALMLPGKQGNTLEKGEKMVVQVNRENSEPARRRVEVVNVEREARVTKRARGESGSEGENVRRRKVTVTYRNGVDEGEKGKKAAAASKEGKSGPKRVKGEKKRSSVERGSVRSKEKVVFRKKKSLKGSSSRSASSSSDNDSVEEVKQRTKKRKKQPHSSSSSESDEEPKSLPRKRLENQPVRRVIAPSKNSVRRPPSLPPTSPAPATPPSPSDLLDQALEDLTGEIVPSLANEQKLTESERISALRSNNYNSSDPKLKEIVVQRVSSANNHSGRVVKERKDGVMEGPTVLFDNTTIKKEKEDSNYVETTIEKVKLETVKKEEDAKPIAAASDPNKTKPKSTVSQDKSTGVIAKEAPKVKNPERTSRMKNKKASSGSDGGSSDSDTDKETVAASKKKKSSDSSSDSDEESRKRKRKSKQSRVIRKKRRESSSNSSGSDVAAKKSRTDKKRRKRSSSSNSSGGSGSSSSSSSSDDDYSSSDRKAKNKSKTEKGTRKKAAPPSARDRRSDKKEPQRSKGRDRRSRSRSRRRSRERMARKSRK